MTQSAWPALEFVSWAPTKRSLHALAQMLGKLRLALSPHQPNFTFTALAPTPRGFSTGLVPYGLHALEASVDLDASELRLVTSAGGERRIALREPETVASVFAALHEALRAFGIDATLSPIPQEVADPTPYDADERTIAFDRQAARNWHEIVIATSAAFERWRAHFFGRTGIYLWWGGFDLSLMLFNGKHVTPPADRGYLIKYDLDAELMNAGFYPGDEANPASFYAYIYPQPAGCSALPIAPEGAFWSQDAGEWILPYDAVRVSADPEKMLFAFLDAVYGACGSAAGWNRAALGYIPPPLRRAPVRR